MDKNTYNYKIYGDYSIIFLPYKNNIIENFVDTEDLERIINYKYKWFVKKCRDPYYVMATEYVAITDERDHYAKSLFLHRFIMNASDDELVDHKDNNTFNNRKYNLRSSDVSHNTKNRKGKNSNNTSGHRNVSMIAGWYRIQLQIDGKNYMFPEKFKDADEAGAFAEAMRLKYYGEFAGKG